MSGRNLARYGHRALSQTHSDVDIPPVHLQRQMMWRYFAIASTVRIVLWLTMLAMADTRNDISPDLPDYEYHGQQIAISYAEGNVDWAQWIDNGWFQFIGVVYYIFGDNAVFNLTFVTVVNAVAVGIAVALTYATVMEAYEDHRIAAASAFVFAVFPGAIFFQSLPLKEGTSVFAIMCVVYGLTRHVRRRDGIGWCGVIIGGLILAALRVYLIPVLVYAVFLCVMPMPRIGFLRQLVRLSLYGIGFAMLGFYLVGQSGIAVDQHEAFQYFDVERLNQTRASLIRGSGRMYSEESKAVFGEDWLHNLVLAARGLFHFIVSVDLTRIRSLRQFAAVPEAVLLISALPLLIRGLLESLRRKGQVTLPIIVFFFALMFVYSSASTNLGALYRWRLQALPLLLILIFYGASLRSRGLFCAVLNRFRMPFVRSNAPRGRTRQAAI